MLTQTLTFHEPFDAGGLAPARPAQHLRRAGVAATAPPTSSRADGRLVASFAQDNMVRAMPGPRLSYIEAVAASTTRSNSWSMSTVPSSNPEASSSTKPWKLANTASRPPRVLAVLALGPHDREQGGVGARRRPREGVAVDRGAGGALVATGMAAGEGPVDGRQLDQPGPAGAAHGGPLQLGGEHLHRPHLQLAPHRVEVRHVVVERGHLDAERGGQAGHRELVPPVLVDDGLGCVEHLAAVEAATGFGESCNIAQGTKNGRKKIWRVANSA